MKKVVSLLTICFITSVSIIAAQTKEKPVAASTPSTTPVSGAEISFEKEIHDYGTIDKGANGVYEFKFKIPGKEPLIITNATGSCGCTVPVWPKEPILPGATSTIKVSYDTKRVGPFNKTVTIVSNAKESPKTITIKGVVNAKPEEETFPAKKVGAGAPLEKN